MAGATDTVGEWARRRVGTHRVMEPIPETLEAIAELDALLDDGTLLHELRRTATRAQDIAPGLAGVSVALRVHDLTFTLVASDEEIAALDAIQYLSSGPCVAVVEEGMRHGVATTADDLFSEARWQDLARATAAAGIHSTVTFPIIDGQEVTGSVNLYGHEEHTFDGLHAELADVFRAWAPGAVTNADLAFSTRRLAEKAPAQLREDALVDTAVGILAASREISFDSAREQLADSAARAGVPIGTLARVIIELQEGS
jgi:GAF domain-containing protein